MAALVADAFAGDRALKLVVGQTTTVSLEENPSTGYQWQIDFAAGSNISIIHVTDNGFSQEAAGNHPLVGAPGIHSWTIEATGSGTAIVVFVYRREWEATPVRRRVVTIEASPS